MDIGIQTERSIGELARKVAVMTGRLSDELAGPNGRSESTLDLCSRRLA